MKTNNLKGNIVISDPNNKEIFNRYLSEISGYKPLIREEEIEVFKLVEAGDQRAIDKICRHNLLFVVSVAKQYQTIIGYSTLTLEDLINEGNMGMLLAVKKFDYREGNKFISMAVWWIKQAILTCIQRHIKSIRIPSNIRGVINKISRKESKLEQLLGRTPTTLEVFEALLEDQELTDKETPERLDEYLKMGRFEKSLDSFVNDEETTQLNQLVMCSDADAQKQMESKERVEFLFEMLSKIPTRAQSFIKDYYGIDTDPLTLREIAEKNDVTAETVRQVVKKFIRRLRSSNRDKEKYFFPTPDYAFKKQFPDFDTNALYLI